MLHDRTNPDRKEEFRIVVTGGFGSGKSSVLNVILDDIVLPSRAVPCTEVITELRYGDQKKVIVYPKKGMHQGGDMPFEIEPEKLSEYQSFAMNQDRSVRNPFEKIEVYWPVMSLSNGLVLIDTPAHNDWETPIVFTYASADLILYCLNVACVFSMTDVRILEQLNAIADNNLVCLITRMDIVDNTEDLQRIYTYCEQRCNKLGLRQPPFYVSNRLALEALQENSDTQYALSGFAPLMNEIDSRISASRMR